MIREYAEDVTPGLIEKIAGNRLEYLGHGLYYDHTDHWWVAPVGDSGYTLSEVELMISDLKVHTGGEDVTIQVQDKLFDYGELVFQPMD